MTDSETNALKLKTPAAWVDEHGDAMFAYALSRVCNREVAEDLVQDALVAALESVHTFEGRSSERTWLIGVLRHKVLDHFRRTRRTREVPNLSIGKAHGTLGLYSSRGKWTPKPGRWGADPAEVYENREFWEVYHLCREKLPTTLAEAYILRELEGLAPKEICNILDISATNLSVRLHRARLALRHCLDTLWFDR